MSLRAFHIFFIIVALGFCAFFTAWSGQRLYHVGGMQYGWLTFSAVLALAAGCPYLYWFISKKGTAGPEDNNDA